VADPGSGDPWEWRTLGGATPGSGEPWEWRNLGVADPNPSNRLTRTHVLPRSQRKPIFLIEVYRRIILQCNGSWTPYIDGLLPHMMFDESNYFSLQWKWKYTVISRVNSSGI